VFNQAPINKREAQKALQENIVEKNESGKSKNKRSAFMAKLYDEEEVFEDEMKVFEMGQESEEEKETTIKTKKRDAKVSDKKVTKGQAGKSSKVSTSKINRLVIFSINDTILEIFYWKLGSFCN